MKPCQYIWIQEITQTTSDGTSLRLAYFLTLQDADAPGSLLYGICVRKYQEGAEPEEAMTPPISHSEDFVRQLLQHVIAHAVTPMCLLEVLDELISYYEEHGLLH